MSKGDAICSPPDTAPLTVLCSLLSPFPPSLPLKPATLGTETETVSDATSVSAPLVATEEGTSAPLEASAAGASGTVDGVDAGVTCRLAVESVVPAAGKDPSIAVPLLPPRALEMAARHFSISARVSGEVSVASEWLR